jgi:hypothetical protein
MAGNSNAIIILLIFGCVCCLVLCGLSWYQGWTCSLGLGNSCSSSSSTSSTPSTSTDGGPSTSTPSTTDPLTDYTLSTGTLNNMDFHDLPASAPARISTLNECAAWCTNNAQCETFLFNPSGVGYGGDPPLKCWFKDSQVPGNTIGSNQFWTKNIPGYTKATGPNNNMDYHDVGGGDAITNINTCASTCSTTPTCKSFLFNDNGLGGAYGSKKCAFKDAKVPDNKLGNGVFYSQN